MAFPVGFTYGYQWNEHQPLPELRFPLTGTSIAGTPIRIYPVLDEKNEPPVSLWVEWFDPEVRGSARWENYPMSRKNGGVMPLEYARSAVLYPSATDIGRLHVALDWHMESGFNIAPFLPTLQRAVWPEAINPIAFMGRVIRDRDPNLEAWWLDERITSPAHWDRKVVGFGGTVVKYVVWELDIWGNAYDGYEQNNRHRAGTIEVPDDGEELTMLQALADGGFLNAAAVPRLEISNDGGDGYEVLGPEVVVAVEGENQEPVDLLPASFADEIWTWAFERTLDGYFGDREHGGPMNSSDVVSQYPSAWAEAAERIDEEPGGTEATIEALQNEAFTVARAASEAAMDAMRNESRIPLFWLEQQED